MNISMTLFMCFKKKKKRTNIWKYVFIKIINFAINTVLFRFIKQI